MNQLFFSLTVFLAGILSFFSPCVFPLLPVYIGILLGSDQEKAIRLFGKTNGTLWGSKWLYGLSH